MMGPLRFSLILSTVGRALDLKRFFVSLDQQTYRNFELILVDQSDTNELCNLIGQYIDKLSIRHLRSLRGLSRGRNVGLTAATGDVICFPDDDCWYGNDLLERVAAAFNRDPTLDGLTGALKDDPSGVIVGRWDNRGGVVTRMNVWHRAISMTIFLRRQVAQAVGPFDEMLGIGSGSPFSAGEETDFLIRSIDQGAKIIYDPTLIAFHPNKKYLPASVDRAFGYGAGMGFVMAKSHYTTVDVLPFIIRPLLGTFVYLMMGNAGKARYHFRTMKGRWWGYREEARRPQDTPLRPVQNVSFPYRRLEQSRNGKLDPRTFGTGD